MTWTNPRWASLKGPDADVLRSVFQSLSDFLEFPAFNNGLRIGQGASPSYNPATDVVTRPTMATIDSENVLVLPATIVSGKYIRSGNYVAGSAGWNIDGDGNAEFNNVTARGTFRTGETGERISISASTNGAYTANWIEFFSPRDNGADPHTPGRIFADMTGTNVGQLYIRPPYSDAGSGQALFGLESEPFGGTRVYMGGANGTQPFFEMRGDTSPNQVNIFEAGSVFIDGDVELGPTRALRSPIIEGSAVGSAAVLRCASSNELHFTWSGGQIHFYIDGALVKSL